MFQEGITVTNNHLIGGQWIAAQTLAIGEAVDQAAQSAEAAFDSFANTPAAQRASFLRAVAEEIDARGDLITEAGVRETALPEARLVGERGRTTGQLRMFADHIEDGTYLDRRYDEALPDRQPMARPSLRLMQRPIGPVAVFGASNFPLAFSTAGGDTASAWAAGCPVVVKAHPAHPETGVIVAKAIQAAIERCGLHSGVFSFVQGDGVEPGQLLVQHPLIKAVGFTGSLGGGRALFDLCASRPEPIPFFGELGSVNPVFVSDTTLKARGNELAEQWCQSLTMGVGQFCTNPGIVVLQAGEEAEAFIEVATKALSNSPSQTMLTDGIAAAYHKGSSELSSAEGTQTLLEAAGEGRTVTPALLRTSAQNWLSSKALGEEVFGPLGLVVVAEGSDEVLAIARALEGQLTCTLQIEQSDKDFAKSLLPILERKAGRILVNGFPTGVEVADAMVHGGPYPASTNFGATSVGSMAIRRFLRPVCYQNVDEELMPEGWLS
ncbi:aldehyde dehydrogenase (NADP(+)) [Pseudovibrio flavus]|uniref:aldehyde dehydrogenase (NADP(+)) n=1 Tax=Pseudovibrio flavus TaxID=2529854 RepID=UPI00211B8272|nr:aldehyde dehydrogenase (NADP(+)) [Pseudovibrio flavus]